MKKLFAMIIFFVICFFPFQQWTSTNSQKDISYLLIIVNVEHPVIDHLPLNLVSANDLLADDYAFYGDIKIDETLIAPLENMAKAAQAEGVVGFQINSGYRNEIEQQQLYEEYGEMVALPAGSSEHQLGTAIDIGSVNGKMGDSVEYAWLKDNAHRYGFILRYPQDAVEVTGIAFEPWHYRYVGLPHSYIMYENNWTLEKYVQNIQQQDITYTLNDKTYHIHYSKQVPRNTLSLMMHNGGAITVTTE